MCTYIVSAVFSSLRQTMPIISVSIQELFCGLLRAPVISHGTWSATESPLHTERWKHLVCLVIFQGGKKIIQIFIFQEWIENLRVIQENVVYCSVKYG